MFFTRLRLALGLIVLAFSGCALNEAVPQKDKIPVTDLTTIYRKPGGNLPSRNSVHSLHSAWHEVQKGETLFSIAFRYGLDFKGLAKINRINPPYIIYPGQKIILKSHKIAADKNKNDVQIADKKANNGQNQSKGYKNTESNKKLIQKNNSFKPDKKVLISWRWPATGSVISNFSKAGIGNKGIDISGTVGEPVYAAAEGQVVYSGNGLIGYGNLIIIKHNNSYLSAYGHNSHIDVKEGDQVKSGEKIAEIGSTGANRNKLHFEIRREGKPVDPLTLLPPRR